MAQRLAALAQLYQQSQPSALIERTLDKVLAYEADTCRAQLAQLQADLAEFEERYGLSSDEFYRHFQAGQTDDRLDYVEWASLVQMADNAQKRLRLLTGEGLARHRARQLTNTSPSPLAWLSPSRSCRTERPGCSRPPRQQHLGGAG